MEYITIFLALLVVFTAAEILLMLCVSNISDKLERVGLDVEDIYMHVIKEREGGM